MAQTQVIAKVSELSGQAFVRDGAGNMRRLKLGDVIREGESVVAADGAKVVLALADGREMTVRPGETAKLDAEVAAAVMPDAADSAVVNDQGSFQKIAKALQSGSDLDALLEEDAPAAGLAGQGGNEGHTFIELLRIVETVDPLAFQFGTNRGRPIESTEAAPVTLAAADEPGQVLFARNDANAVSELVDSAAVSGVSGNVLAAGAATDVADSGLPGAVLAVTEVRFGATVAAPGSIIALAHGTLVVAADGSYTYTLDNADPVVNALNVGNQLAEQVTYTISDGLGHTAQANLTLTINGANDTPTATPTVTAIVMPEDGSVVVPLSGSDPDSPIDFVTVTTLPTDGVLLKPDGTPVVAGQPIPVDPVSHQALLTFVPDANFSGTVTFAFSVTDTGGLTSAPATQQIDVTPVNDPPVAVVTPASGDEDTPISVRLTGTDLDGTLQHVSVTTLPPVTQGVLYLADGTTSVTANTPLSPSNAASLIFKPAADFNGTVNIPFTVTDNNNATSAPASTPITVNPVNDPPVAVVTPASGDEDTPISVSLTGTDLDGTLQYITVTTLPPVTQGVLYLADGTTPVVAGTPLSPATAAGLIFQPAPDFNGPVNIPFTVTDNSNATSALAVTPITVNPTSDPTTITGDTSGSGTEDAATPITGTLSATDPDGLTDGTVFSVTTNGGHGTASIDPATGAWTYTPVADYNGPDSFTVTITDDLGNTSTQLISLTVNPEIDIAANSVTTDEDTAITIDVLANDNFEGTPTVSAVGTAAHGTVLINPDNTVTYTPAANYNGPDSFTYTVTSPTGVTETATVSITVNPTSDPTTITGDTSGSGTEDAATPITGTLGATDPDGLTDGTVFSVTTNGGHGTASIDPATGAWTYTPVADYNGPDSFTVTITDDLGNTSSQLISLTVNPEIDIAANSVTTDEDTAITIDVLANDHFEGTPTISAVGTAAHGTVLINPDNTVTYTPAANYNGPDSFTYTVTSPAGVTETATVNITVTPINDAPVAGDDIASTEINKPVTVDVKANDNDPDNANSDLTVSNPVVDPTKGTVVVNPDGTLTFTPANNVTGPISITYTLTDPSGLTDTATVTVNVGSNTPPEGADKSFTFNEDQSQAFSAADFGFTDADLGQTLQAVRLDNLPATGSLTLNGAAVVAGQIIAAGDLGELRYTPVPNGNGTPYASFSFSVQDSAGTFDTAPNTITLNVTPVNDLPYSNPTTVNISEDQTHVLVGGDFDMSDIDGTVVSVHIGSASGGVLQQLVGGVWTTLTIPAGVGIDIAKTAVDAGELRFVPVADLNGNNVAGITYKPVDDQGGTTGIFTQIAFRIAAVADIANDTLTTNEDTAVTILASSLLTNDNFEGTPVVTAVGSAAHGTVALVGGNITYTPNGNYNGPDSFTYTVTSPTGVTETATVNVTVNPLNDPTNVTGGTSGAGNEDTAITGTLTATDNDGLADGTVYTVTGAAGHGTASIDAATGAWSYTPVGDYNGADSFTVTITDDAGNTTTQAISLTIAAVADIANDTLTTNEDTAVTILASSLLTNDNFEGTPVVTAVGSAAHGTVALVGGNLTYTPNGNYNGPDSFTYTVTSPTGVTETATVNVTVNPLNDPTNVTGGTSGAGNEDTAITGTLTATDNDGLADGTVYTVTGAAGHGTASIDAATGAWSYTPVGDYNGLDSFTVTITDDAGNTTTQAISLTIAAVADIANDTLTTNEDTAVTILASSLLTNDNFEGTPVVTAVGSAAHGTVALVGGNLTYTPNGNYNGPDSFTYTVTSPTGVTETATVNVTVNPLNDPTNVTGGTSGAGNEDTAITGTLTATDNDGLADGTVYTVTGAAGHGTASIDAATGAWSYTPVGDYNGADSFTVTITDDAGNTTTQAISLTIAAVADIANDTLTTNEDTAVTILASSLLTNDNFEGTPVVTAVGSAAHGTVALVGGNLTYTPNGNYNGPDSFTYTVTSPTGVTETATVNVTVNPLNDPTNVTGGTSGAGNEDTAITGTLTATDNDGLADGTVYTVTGAAGHGTASIDAATGAWSYTPVGDYNGADSFTVTITDDAGNTTTQAISLTIAAVADIANDTLTTNEDTAVTILASSLLTNDNFEGTPVVTAVGSAAHGTVALVGGNLTYTPNGNYNGPDSFTYTVTSPTGVTETATVNVTVNPLNDPTNVTGGTSGAGNEDTAITGTLTATDNDGLADGTVYTVTGAAGHGTASIDAATGAWSYTPVGDYNGLDSFTVTITDDAGNTTTQAISLTIAAVADIANDTLTTNEDTAVTILASSLLTNDNFEGTPVVTAVGSAAHGTVALVGGNLTYTPNGNYNGPDSFTYTVTSPTGVTETATVNVTVNPLNDPTNVTGGTSGAGNEDTAITGTLTATDNDGLADGTVYTVTGAAGHGTASIDAATGAWSYTPVGDYNGADSFTVTITDDAGNTTTQAISLTIAAVADIANDTLTTNEDTAVTILASSLLTNDNFEGTPVVTAVGSAAHGTVALVGGNLTYTPNGNYNGPDSFTYTVTSPTGVTETATVNVTVNPLNDPTNVTGGTSGAGNEDTAITGTLTATDNDGLADGTVYTVTGAAGHGTASIDAATGAWSYTPVGDYNGADSFTVTITDDAGNTTTQAISLTIAAVADIANDTLTTNEDTAVTILASSLLTNDNFEGTPVVTAVGSAAHGTVALVGGNITYTPNGNYNGPDSFTYTVTSPTGVTETATVNVTVNPLNDPTNVTGGTSGAGNEDTAITGTLTATDNDGLADGTVYTVTGAAGHGTASIDAATGAWSYTPVGDYNGLDSFTVTITDDAGNTTTQAISLTIAAVADIANDTLTTNEDTAVTILASSLLTNDNFEGTPVVTAVGSAAHGTVALVGGNLTYTPNGNYNGPDSFTYTVTSPTGVTETATVNVTVNPLNDPTNVTGGTSGAGNEDTPITGTLTATDNDGLADGSVYTVTGAAGHGTASIDAATGAWSYTPVGDYNGADSFTVTITDDAGNTTTQAISLTIAAVADIANDTLTTNEDTAVTIDVLANDNFEGTPTVSAVGTAAHGTVLINPDNTVTYTPAANYNGPDSFTYTVTSPTGVTETATVNITVAPTSDPTTITGDTSGSGTEDAATPITGTLSATDPDGLTDGTVFSVTTNGGHGTASIDPATGAWTYTPVADYNGPDSFTVTITDDLGNTSTQLISLTVNPEIDIAANSVTTDEDTAITIDVLANDHFEGTPTVSAVGTAAHGTVLINADNTVTYTPAANYNGPDSFTYTVTSPAGVTETATVSVTVNPLNDPTNVTGGTSGAGNEDTAITGTLTATDNDGLADGSVYTVTGAAGHGTASIDAATGAWSYTPVGDYNGLDSFTVTITDDAGNTTTQAISLTIAAVADIANDTLTTNEDTAVTILASSLLTNDNFEGTPVVTAVGSAAHGTVALVGGNLTYTPSGNYNGPDSFTYTVTSPTGVTETATVNVTVNPLNDAPLGQNLSVTTAEDVPYVFSLSSFPMSDVEQGSPSNPSSIRIDSMPANGVLSLNGVAVTLGQLLSAPDISAGLLVFTPAPDANGANYANFNFSVQDASGLFDPVPNTVTVNVTAVSDGTPLAGNDNYLTTLGTPITLTPSQLLVNDYLPDHARITNVSAISSGTLIANANGTYTFTPAGTGNATFTYTVTDDEGQASMATVTIQTVAARDDLATVNESALPDGTGGGTTVATGNVLTNDGGGTGINQIVYNGTTYTASGGYITINTASGRLVVDASGTGAGDYTYTLLRNADNSAAANDNSVVETFQYSSNTGVTANLRVTINDDQPVAINRVVQVSEDAVPSYRLVLVLDVSGSMDTANAGGEVRNIADDGTVSIATRLAMAKEAMASLVSEYFNQAQNVSITFITFSSTATIVNAAPITDKATALSTILTLDGSGGTNYESALNAVKSAFGTTVDTSVQNTVYFISDGAPSQGNVSDPAGAAGYNTWLAANPAVDSYAVGVGTGIATTSALNAIHNVDANGDGVKDGAIIVPDLNDLSSALLSTVPVAYGGNIISNSNLGNVLGADGGYVQTLTMMLDTNADGTPDTNVVFSYNPATDQISRSGSFPAGFPVTGDLLTLKAGQGFDLGTLTFNFKTGAYTYFTSGSAAEGDSFALTFVARDGDGDVTPATTLTVEIADGKPVARSDIDTLIANQTHLDGNVISGLGTDGGQALGGTLTSFAASGSGVDTAVDGAQVSSVTFKGQVYDLTTSGSGSGAGYTWSISGGKLAWAATSGGEKLVFATTGFYDYTPPTASLPAVSTGATVTTNFTSSGNAAANGVVLTGYSRTGVAQTLNYSNPTGSTNDGVGINGGGSNTAVDNLETLVISFAQASHANGVQGVSFVVATDASNLGDNGSGTITSLTYSVFDVSGALLGRFYSYAEGTVTIPSEYSNIGYIEIEANSAASARITSVSFADVLTNTTASAVAPTEIAYILTDTDGDASSATLTLRVMANNVFGDGADNSIVGTNANDRIDGGAGNDTISGGLGHDLVIGGAGNDILNGNDGNDELRGGTGNDTLYGGAGNDILSGGFGTDILTGGAGSDVFRWELTDRGASGSVPIDTVVDFVDAGDKLDLRDLLQGETSLGGVTGNLTNYLHFTTSGSDTVIQVSSAGGFSGGFNAGAVDQTILVENVDLTVGGTLASDQQIIQQLLLNNKLITD